MPVAVSPMIALRTVEPRDTMAGEAKVIPFLPMTRDPARSGDTAVTAVPVANAIAVTARVPTVTGRLVPIVSGEILACTAGVVRSVAVVETPIPVLAEIILCPLGQLGIRRYWPWGEASIAGRKTLLPDALLVALVTVAAASGGRLRGVVPPVPMHVIARQGGVGGYCTAENQRPQYVSDLHVAVS